MSDDYLKILTDISSRLGTIESHLETLVGNGQPGLIKEMRDDIDSLKNTRTYGIGFLAGGELVLHYVLHRLGIR